MNPMIRRTGVVVVVLLVMIGTSGCRRARTMPEADAAAPGERVVALTFDDGPSPYTPAVLDVLAKHKVKATFFVVGTGVDRHPAILERTVREGHRVGNHTLTHPSLTSMSDGQVAQQVGGMQHKLAQRGVRSICVRPPYGAVNKRVDNVIRASAEASYTMLWSIDPQDWRNPPARTIADRVVSQLSPGAVILLHDGGGNRAQTVAALDQLIPRIRAAGFKIGLVC